MEQYSLFKLHIGFNNAFKSFPDDSAQYSKSFLHENLTHFSDVCVLDFWNIEKKLFGIVNMVIIKEKNIICFDIIFYYLLKDVIYNIIIILMYILKYMKYK